jgi:hypothetical protein
MQREKLYNLHNTAFLIVALFTSKLVKILSNQILAVRKRHFFGTRWFRYFLFHLFLTWYFSFKKKQNTLQDAAWKALQFTQYHFFNSCTFYFQNSQNFERPNFDAAKKSFFNARSRFFFLIYYLKSSIEKKTKYTKICSVKSSTIYIIPLF